MMKTKQRKTQFAIGLAACAMALGISGCGGGKDDPTYVALRPPKVQTATGAGTSENGGNGGGSNEPAKEGYGKIKGRIVIADSDKGGVPQNVVKFAIGKATVDTGFCAAKMPIFDESLVVNPMNGGIQNVFFYLEKKPSGGKKQIASQSTWPTAGEAGKLVLDQQNCTYKPHAMVVVAGGKFLANSQDSVVHSYKGSPRKSPTFNVTIPSNGSKEVSVFTRSEKYPVPISCATHSWMSGYQLPLDHPYAAVTDADGGFEISDLPSGEHEFIIWHEKGGTVTEQVVTVSADEETDLGDITISLSQLNK